MLKTSRSANFLGRKKLATERIRLDLSEVDSQSREFSLRCELTLHDGDLPPAAERVVVELYRQTYVIRFQSDLSPGAPVAFTSKGVFLGELETLRARVSVVNNEGRILASARGLVPTLDGKVQPLLPFKKSTSLGQEIWKLSLENDRPIVLVNAGVPGGWMIFHKRHDFLDLVLPAIMREIGAWLWNKFNEGGEDLPGVAEWLAFCDGLGCHPAEAAAADTNPNDWVNELTMAYCAKHAFLKRTRVRENNT